MVGSDNTLCVHHNKLHLIHIHVLTDMYVMAGAMHCALMQLLWQETIEKIYWKLVIDISAKRQYFVQYEWNAEAIFIK